MNNDVTTLQVIADTLEHNPMASQRVLAENAGMSIGLMNAVLKRFVERGWIMLTNVNLRKLSYAITPEGIAELKERSQGFAKRTFKIANQYNDILFKLITDSRTLGKTTVVLYGQSYIKFMLVYACQSLNVNFQERSINEPVDPAALCIVGELNDEKDIVRLEKKGCINLLSLQLQ